MGKLRLTVASARPEWLTRVTDRLSPERVSGLARRLVDRLSEEEKLAIVGLVTTLILKGATNDPRVRLLLLVAALVAGEVLSAYLEVDSGVTVRS